MRFPKSYLIIIGVFFLAKAANAGRLAERAPQFFLYEDSLKVLTAEGAYKLFKQGKFTLAKSREYNIGFTRSVFWLAYEQEKDTRSDSLLMYIGNLHINRIHFYFESNGKFSQQWVTGDHYPFSQRPVKATNFYFPVNSKGVYLARVDKSSETLQMSFDLLDRFSAIVREKDFKIVMAFLTGIIALMICFGFYLYAISKGKVYLYYSAYITCGWLWVLSNAGYGFQYLWPQLPWFASKARPFFASTPIIFSMLFLVHFIGAINNKRLVTGIKILTGIFICLSVLILLFNENGYEGTWWLYIQYLIPLIPSLYLVLLFAILISEIINGNKQAMFYLVAMLALIVSAIFQASFSFGKITDSRFYFSHFGLASGYIIEAIILTAGLVYRFNKYRQDKEMLLKEINLRQAINTRVMIEVQEVERNQVANQLHDVAGSLLSAAMLNLSALRARKNDLSDHSLVLVQHTEQAVTLVSEMVRNLSHALSPVMMSKVGFKTSLEKVVSIFNASGKIKIDLIVLGFEEYDVALNSHYTAFYGIIYELLNNVVKHSNAKNVLLQVTEHPDCFSLIAEDDGMGIDAQKMESNQHLGITGIRSKVEFFKGDIAFDINIPQGLIVTIQIPTPTNEAQDNIS